MRQILLIVAILLLSGVCLAQTTAFDQCGVVEQAFDCALFHVFWGPAYELKTLPADMHIGDTVRVFGTYDVEASLCMSGGLCCLYVDSTVACSAPSSPVPVSGPVGILILCVLVVASGAVLLYRRFRLGNCSTP
jgi:hypothetical protein